MLQKLVQAVQKVQDVQNVWNKTRLHRRLELLELFERLEPLCLTRRALAQINFNHLGIFGDTRRRTLGDLFSGTQDYNTI